MIKNYCNDIERALHPENYARSSSGIYRAGLDLREQKRDGSRGNVPRYRAQHGGTVERKPGMRERKDRFYGPFQHRQQWRVVVVTSDGARGYRYFASEAEGARYVREARILTENRTVGSEVSAYLESLRERGNHRPSTIATIEARLKSFLRLREHDTPISELTPGSAAKLYDRRVRQCKADTHRAELATTSQFCDRWLVAERKLLKENPFAGVVPRGSVAAGKTTLYVDEARIFLRSAMDEGTDDGLACSVVLIFGLRASEVSNLTCADLDAGGTILRVTAGKTRNAIRAIQIPAEPPALRERLISLRAARAPGDQLFPGMTRYRLHYHVTRLCAAAGVTKVCPHGLRGSAITMAAATGGLHVAQLLAGHSLGAAVTERHYIAPGTLESGRAAETARVLTERNRHNPGNEWATEAPESFPGSDGQSPTEFN